MNADLELEGVAVRPPAKVAVPDRPVVHVPLGEGRGGGEALVAAQLGAPPALGGAVGRHGEQHHLPWTERRVCQIVSKPASTNTLRLGGGGGGGGDLPYLG